MRQVFAPSINVVIRVGVVAAVLGLAVLTWACQVYTRSSYGTGMGLTLLQPIPFSHQHHVGILGIDCRYCHTSVEQSPFAGIPPTKTCMNCHSQIWVGSQVLAPVRESYRSDESIRWKRIYNLPGFVYFDHHIHVQKGIGCTSCHGRVDQMPFTYQVSSLLMEWCLDCHRNPEQHLRPRAEVFNMRYEPPHDQEALGRQWVKEYQIRDSQYLTSCSTCHR